MSPVSTNVVESPLGRFKAVGPGPLPDNFVFECPGCGTWAYLDLDQWHGRVSVDHSGEGIGGTCTYHETHDYAKALHDAIAEAVRPPVQPTADEVGSPAEGKAD